MYIQENKTKRNKLVYTLKMDKIGQIQKEFLLNNETQTNVLNPDS